MPDTATAGLQRRNVESTSVTEARGTSINLDALSDAVRQWHDEGGVAVFAGHLKTGPWLDVFNAFVLAQVAVCGARPISHDAPLWLLCIDGVIPTLHPTDSIPQGEATAVIPTSRENISIKTLMWLRRAKVEHLWLLDGRGWVSAEPAGVLSDLMARRRIKPLLRRLAPGLLVDSAAVARGLAGRIQPSSSGTEAVGETVVHATTTRNGRSAESAWRLAIEEDNETFRAAHSGEDLSLRIVQYTGCLYSGGAERQLCNTAIGLHQRGHRCTVRTQHDLEGQHAHYLPLLSEVGIDAGRAGRGRIVDQAALSRVRWDLVALAPDAIRSYVANLALELAADPPDVLHAWLDHPNVIAGLAGIAAGVPCILLGTRNYNPTHFPRFYSPFVDWYRVVAQSKRVHWLANSHRGAESYAQYVGIDESRFHIVFNGLFRDHFDRPSAAKRRGARERLGLSAEAPVVAVVNRLDEEKQPELMLKVIALLRQRLPELRVLVAGSGPLEDRLRQIIAKRDLERTVTLLGRVNDVVEVMSASDVLLLTSRYEGCPNVALEAQHIGVPVVATDAGGTRDAVAHGATGYVCGVDDAPGLVMSLQRLLQNTAERETFGLAAQEYVDTCFNLDQMVDLTCRVYHRALRGEDDDDRIQTPRPAVMSAREPSTPEAAPSDGVIPMVETVRSQAVRT